MEKLIGDNTIVFFADPSRDCAPQEKDWVTKATDFIQKCGRLIEYASAFLLIRDGVF
jgi:hypothetical protein